MIPKLRSITGTLPPGVHEATWAEFVLRYGYNKWRQRLLIGLEQLIADLSAAGCRRIYVDGSFIMDNPSPGDFDCCWEEAGVDENLLPAELLDTWPPRKAQKDKYRGDIFPAHAPADLLGTTFLRFFQRDRLTGKVKGVIAINLEQSDTK